MGNGLPAKIEHRDRKDQVEKPHLGIKRQVDDAVFRKDEEKDSHEKGLDS